MIDFFFKFTDEATAISDAAGTVYYTATATVNGNLRPGSWNPDRVAPGITVWRASQDTIGTTSIGTTIVTTIIHTPLAGWYGIISVPQVLPGLVNHSALQIGIDRDLAAAGATAIIKCNVTAVLQDLRFAPVFMGSAYPFGNLR